MTDVPILIAVVGVHAMGKSPTCTCTCSHVVKLWHAYVHVHYVWFSVYALCAKGIEPLRCTM